MTEKKTKAAPSAPAEAAPQTTGAHLSGDGSGEAPPEFDPAKPGGVAGPARQVEGEIDGVQTPDPISDPSKKEK